MLVFFSLVSFLFCFVVRVRCILWHRCGRANQTTSYTCRTKLLTGGARAGSTVPTRLGSTSVREALVWLAQAALLEREAYANSH